MTRSPSLTRASVTIPGCDGRPQRELPVPRRAAASVGAGARGGRAGRAGCATTGAGGAVRARAEAVAAVAGVTAARLALDGRCRRIPRRKVKGASRWLREAMDSGLTPTRWAIDQSVSPAATV